MLNNLGCLSAVGVARLLKHDLFENMFLRPGRGTALPLQAPYAPYWSALVFNRLIGQQASVLNTTVESADENDRFSNIHATAFQHNHTLRGLTLLFLNLDDKLQASVSIPSNFLRGFGEQGNCTSVTLYHLTAAGVASPGGHPMLNAPEIALNGVKLEMTAAGELPALKGVVGSCTRPLLLGPLSAMFVQ